MKLLAVTIRVAASDDEKRFKVLWKELGRGDR